MTGRHIKGHEDDHRDISQLDRWARLNISVDKAAKKRLRQIRHQTPASNQVLSVERVTLHFQGQKQSQVNKHDLYQEIYGPITREQWVSLHKSRPI